MSVCDMCAHLGHEQDRPCTFSGACVANTYNVRGTGTLEAFLNESTNEPIDIESATLATAPIETETFDIEFNQFQRGNGWMISDLIQKIR